MFSHHKASEFPRFQKIAFATRLTQGRNLGIFRESASKLAIDLSVECVTKITF